MSNQYNPRPWPEPQNFGEPKSVLREGSWQKDSDSSEWKRETDPDETCPHCGTEIGSLSNHDPKEIAEWMAEGQPCPSCGVSLKKDETITEGFVKMVLQKVRIQLAEERKNDR